MTVKICLERIDTQKRIMVEALLNSGVADLVISSSFARKKRLKIERTIYVRNVDGIVNKKGPIKYTIEINIYYQGHRERTEISRQKWNVILDIPWLTYHNPEID